MYNLNTTTCTCKLCGALLPIANLQNHLITIHGISYSEYCGVISQNTNIISNVNKEESSNGSTKENRATNKNSKKK